MKNNKKGFTLVELIAAIVVLGVILTFATTSVMSQLNKNRKKTIMKSAISYVTAINDNNKINDPDKVISSGTVAQINPKLKNSLTGETPTSGNVTVNATTKEVTSATLHINGYIVTFNGTKYTITAE